jgi:hypothetical protein
MGLSFIFAVTFVIIMTFTLPKTGGASYGLAWFQDPLVLPVTSMGVLISGLVGWPLFTICGWRVPPATVAKITGGTTWIFIVVATPINAGIGWIGSYIVCLLALIHCAARYRTPLYPPGHCQRCGYDLTGNESGICPECGTETRGLSKVKGHDGRS